MLTHTELGARVSRCGVVWCGVACYDVIIGRIAVPVTAPGTEVGYRPLPYNKTQLRALFRKIAAGDGTPADVKSFEEMQTFAHIANDECDFGTECRPNCWRVCCARMVDKSLVLTERVFTCRHTRGSRF